MLFGAEITTDLAKDTDKLCEQLYIFLRAHINKRLKFESDESREDYVQDTIMYLLEKFNSLTDEQKETLNLERYFFNRANSYIGNRLETAKRQYKTLKHYLYENDPTNEAYVSFDPDIVDEAVLSKIVSSYKLPEDKAEILKRLSRNSLTFLGYFGELHPIGADEDPTGTLEALSFSVVDEYLLEMVEGGGTHE
jgi:DNA-directed RNA polymerase specialized sigma24 family protein